jgi:amino-acid N-acetyltransferase
VIRFAAATAADVPDIKSLLAENDLPTAGVDDHWTAFVVAREGRALAGCGGAEVYDGAALIRSIAVATQRRGGGIGDQIVRRLLDDLKKRGVTELYLLTTTAKEYFGKKGFEKVDRVEVPPQLLRSREFQDACPTTATCMRLAITS